MNGGNSKQVNGTSGSPQQSIDQSSYKEQVSSNEHELSEHVQLIEKLKNDGIKFSEKNINFITKDATGQIVWLENGNDTAGLTHIIARHASDFHSMTHISPGHIAGYLHTVFRDGKVCYSRTLTNRRGGFERLYLSEGKYYILSGIGSNGFIVTAYPIAGKKAKKLMERYSND